MMSPGGWRHGCIIAQITGPLQTFVRQQSLGKVSGAETGFQIVQSGYGPCSRRGLCRA